MKLAVMLALVSLALCCSTASATVCRAFLQVIEHLVMGTLSDFEDAIEPFHPDLDMKEAGALMKMSLDKLPRQAKDSLMKLTRERTYECAQGWLQGDQPGAGSYGVVVSSG
ncbi:uteroglobin [Orycteropus afer afer]|uniref:Uteroglobin n=1 Tax=Orycteropus afer afer TaxID=1230840 RepID=A0AC54Z7F6_ORYAF|nr:uteroglobin [Orycteropus afer afer]